jgi:hypothetical protein
MRIALALTVAVLLICSASHCTADEGPYPSVCCHSCGRKVCYPEIKMKKEPRRCWEVERKEICIPAIQFPWMHCSQLRCGRVRVVNVLVEKDYEVEKCGYDWKILCKDCGGTAEPCRK